MPGSKKIWRVGRGTLWQVLPLSKQLVEALQAQGMTLALAAFWIYRQSITLGGGDAEYDSARNRLEKLLKGG